MTKLEKAVDKILTKESEGYSKRQLASEVIEYGCQSGVIASLTYYKDTVKFYKSYEEDIWEFIFRKAEEFGYANVFEFLSTLNGSLIIGNATQVKNLLTWFAFEETVRDLYGGDVCY